MNDKPEITDVCAPHNVRMAAEMRREQLLQISMQLFSQRGFRGTTTREIAVAAGVSEAMVFRHFANKHELYAAILDYKMARSGSPSKDPIINEAMSSKNDFDVFYTFALQALKKQHDDFDFIRLLFYSALENHELSSMFFERFVREIYDFLGSYILLRQQDGVFRDGDPFLFVRIFIGMIFHHSLDCSLFDTDCKLLTVSKEDAARQFTETLLNGITIRNKVGEQVNAEIS